MRKAVVSLVAVLFMAATFAMPAGAAGASGERIKNLSLSVPAVATVGGDVEGTIAISLADASVFNSRTTTLSYRVVAVEGVHSEIPLGGQYLLSRSKTRRVPVGINKSGKFTWTLDERVRPGTYTIFASAGVPSGNGPSEVVTTSVTLTIQ